MFPSQQSSASRSVSIPVGRLRYLITTTDWAGNHKGRHAVFVQRSAQTEQEKTKATEEANQTRQKTKNERNKKKREKTEHETRPASRVPVTSEEERDGHLLLPRELISPAWSTSCSSALNRQDERGAVMNEYHCSSHPSLKAGS